MLLLKKTRQKKPRKTLSPEDKKINKIDINKFLAQEEEEFDRLPSQAKLKRAREKEKLKSQLLENNRISREVIIPELITVQELANRMAEKVADVVKELMKVEVMATATQTIDGDTAEIVVSELGHKAKRVSDIDILKDI